MNDLLVIIGVLIVIIFPIVISLFYFIKTTTKYASFYIDQLILSNILLLFWTVAAIPVDIFIQMFDSYTTILIEQLGTICGITGIIFLIEALLNPIRGTIYHIVPRVSIVAFATLIGMKIYEIIQNDPGKNIYGLQLQADGSFIRTTNIFIFGIAIVAFITFTLTIIYFTFLHNTMPSWIIPQSTKNKANIAIIKILLGGNTNILGLLLQGLLSQLSLVL